MYEKGWISETDFTMLINLFTYTDGLADPTYEQSHRQLDRLQLANQIKDWQKNGYYTGLEKELFKKEEEIMKESKKLDPDAPRLGR